MRRAVVGILLALVVWAPTAGARMVLTPYEFDMDAGSTRAVEVFLQNTARSPTRFDLEARGHGLFVRFDRPALELAPGESARSNATVRAPFWAGGDYTVDVKLVEDGLEVETQTVRVHVTPLGGLPAGLIIPLIAASGSILMIGGLGALTAWRRWHHVAWALYARVHGERLREHPSRALLIELATRNPGMSLADAQKASGLANGPFEHHLAKLVKSNLVAVTARGRGRHLHLPQVASIGPLGGTAEDIVRLLRERGRLRAADVARELDVSRQALHYQIRRLAEAGRIEARLEHGRLVLDASPPRPA